MSIEIEDERPSRKLIRRNVQMPHELWRALDEYAGDHYMTVPEVIRRLVMDELQKGGYLEIRPRKERSGGSGGTPPAGRQPLDTI